MNKFKKNHSFTKRKEESTRIKEKYDNRVPVIVEKDQKSDLKDMDKSKFLAPHDLTLGQFLYVIRKRINIDSSAALYIFVSDAALPKLPSFLI